MVKTQFLCPRNYNLLNLKQYIIDDLYIIKFVKLRVGKASPSYMKVESSKLYPTFNILTKENNIYIFYKCIYHFVDNFINI